MATTPNADPPRIDSDAELVNAIQQWANYRHLSRPDHLGDTAVRLWRIAQFCGDAEPDPRTGLDGDTARQLHRLGADVIAEFRHTQSREPSLQELLSWYGGRLDPLGYHLNNRTGTVEANHPAPEQTQLRIARSTTGPTSTTQPASTDPTTKRKRGESAGRNQLRGPGRRARPRPIQHRVLRRLRRRPETLRVPMGRDLIRRPTDHPPATPSEPGPAATMPPAEREGRQEPRVWFLSEQELAATQAKMTALNQRAARKGFTGNVELHAVAATRSHTPGIGAATVTVHGFEVTIKGEPPRYDGWQFVAAVDTLPVPAGTLKVQPIVIAADGTTRMISDSLYPGERRVHSLIRTESNRITQRLGDFDTADQAAAALLQASSPGIVVRYLPGAEQSLDPAAIRPGECDHCHTTRDRSSVLIVRNDDTDETKQVGRSCVKDFLGWSTLPVLIDPEQAERQFSTAAVSTAAAGTWPRC